MSRDSSPLPIPDGFYDVDHYVESLLAFTTASDLFQTLCGGVHILDFFTREPDVFAELFPSSWRDWFRQSSVEDLLDLLMRRDLDKLPQETECLPHDLLEYVRDIRKHSLRRESKTGFGLGRLGGNDVAPVLQPKVAVGMNPKKKHEVQHFANYVEKLASENAITHLVDFGSGQNYLGRALASKPYNRCVIAIEGKESNIQGARLMDHTSKVEKDVNCFDAGRETHVRPLKATRAGQQGKVAQAATHDSARYDDSSSHGEHRGSLYYMQHKIEDGDLNFLTNVVRSPNQEGPGQMNESNYHEEGSMQTRSARNSPGPSVTVDGNDEAKTRAANSDRLFERHEPSLTRDIHRNQAVQPRVMVISLHSCGNLIHHGLRSLLLNDFVVAVAMIGCCYNLVTERLGPPTYKLPSLRFRNARVVREGLAHDPHGFPMSQRLSLYEHKRGQGIRFNITARMMAVQAPQNWTPEDSNAFFTRHFFRALLQRIFFDRGVVRETCGDEGRLGKGEEERRSSEGTEPLIIGSLRSACYRSFRAYVRGAVAKLASHPQRGAAIQENMDDLSDDEIGDYERRYQGRKKDLCVVWSMMAFSAGLVEACIVVDRWLFLREQQEVDRCWVEPIFDYGQSPRNLVVVGIKRPQMPPNK